MAAVVRKIVWVVVPAVLFAGVSFLINHGLQEHYRKITVGRDTTYVTGPTFADGSVNYLAALNKRFAEGVTPENNAAVPLYLVTNPNHSLTGWRLQTYVQALGVKAKTDTGDTYVDFPTFLFEKAVRTATRPQEIRNLEADLREEWSDQIGKRARGPWRREQDQDAFAWLQQNEAALRLIMSACQRDHFFSPMVGRPDLGSTMGAQLSSLGALRDYCELLAIHGMLALGNHDFPTWRENLLARQRLGRLVMHAPDSIQALVGMGIISQANDDVGAILEHFSPAQARQILSDLRKLPSPPDIVDCDDQCSRLQMISAIADMARFGPTDEDVQHDDPAKPLPAPRSFGFQPPIHFDDLLRQFNSLYDRRIAAAWQPTFSQRQAAFAALEVQRAALSAKVSGSSSTAAIQRFNLLAIEHPERLSVLQDKGREKYRLVELGLLLVAYRGDHGAYPKSLGELPDLAGANCDLFADEQPMQFVPAKSIIYSVGPNQRDDGGIYAPPKKNLSFSALLSGAAGPEPDFPDDVCLRLP